MRRSRRPVRRNGLRPCPRRNTTRLSAKVESQDATRQRKRVLNRITNVNLATTGPNGGTIAYSTLLNPLSAFAGAPSLIEQYEQFRVDKIRVYARPDTTNLAGLATGIAQYAALYAAANNMTSSTYVDYDSFSAPSEQSFLTRDAMKIRSLSGGNFRLIADYVPRCRLSDATNSAPALYPQHSTTWISTNYADLDWLGLALRFTCDSPYWGTGANNAAKVQLFVKISVTFRGLKKNTSTTTTLQSDHTILTEQTYEEDVNSSADLIGKSLTKGSP